MQQGGDQVAKHNANNANDDDQGEVMGDV